MRLVIQHAGPNDTTDSTGKPISRAIIHDQTGFLQSSLMPRVYPETRVIGKANLRCDFRSRRTIAFVPHYFDRLVLNSGRCISMLLDMSKPPCIQETSVSDTLWAQVGECFDTDDGSLPEIELTGLSREGMAAINLALSLRQRLPHDELPGKMCLSPWLCRRMRLPGCERLPSVDFTGWGVD